MLTTTTTTTKSIAFLFFEMQNGLFCFVLDAYLNGLHGLQHIVQTLSIVTLDRYSLQSSVISFKFYNIMANNAIILHELLQLVRN